jgi:hypothetical protein
MVADRQREAGLEEDHVRHGVVPSEGGRGGGG